MRKFNLFILLQLLVVGSTLSQVSFTALPDLCINDGVQNGLSGGTPAGGVYSGPGVTDDSNGMTYSFNPTTAGAGTHTIMYTISGNGRDPISASDNVMVSSPCISFTALDDLCINDGVQNGLSGGNPTGGVYSGPGVTDDGNGMTYSFNPTTAGAGTHTIMYTISGNGRDPISVSDNVVVSSSPCISFTALDDLCINDGVQNGLSGGNPTGGVYSGPGVTDDSNGMTYSFNPTTAGAGTHTIMYTISGNGRDPISASDNVMVSSSPCISFTALDDLCINDGVQNGLSGGNPTGGVYSGPGVTDDSNGMTYSFNPAAAGVGTHTIMYTISGNGQDPTSANDNVVVGNSSSVSFTALDDLCVNDGEQAVSGGGTPTGGVYSGPGVTDDGNGMTYSFDPTAAGVGTHTLTYTITDSNTSSCTSSSTDMVEVRGISRATIDTTLCAGMSYDAPSGNRAAITADSTGLLDTIMNAAGCDSVLTINVSFNQLCDPMSFGLSFGDPCFCENPLNNRAGGIYYFHDSLTITSMMPLDSIVLSSPLADFFAGDSGTLHTAGTNFVMTPGNPLEWKLEFWRPSGATPVVNVTAYTGAAGIMQTVPAITFDPTCFEADCIQETIPTLGEWGLVLLGLVMMAVSIVAIRQQSILPVTDRI